MQFATSHSLIRPLVIKLLDERSHDSINRHAYKSRSPSVNRLGPIRFVAKHRDKLGKGRSLILYAAQVASYEISGIDFRIEGTGADGAVNFHSKSTFMTVRALIQASESFEIFSR